MQKKLLSPIILTLLLLVSCSNDNPQENLNIELEFGNLDINGEFCYSTEAPRIFADIQFISQLEYASKTNNARYIRFKLPEKITNVNRLHLEVVGTDENGKIIDNAEEISIWFDNAGLDEEEENIFFISDKPVVLINNYILQGEHNFCYAIYMKTGKIRYELKHSQF